SITAVLAHAASEAPGAHGGQTVGLVEQRANYFLDHIVVLSITAQMADPDRKFHSGQMAKPDRKFHPSPARWQPDPTRFQKGIESPAALGREALDIAQWAVHSSTGAAVQEMALRFASGGGALAAAVREQQDLSTTWRNMGKALFAAWSKPESQQNQTDI